MGDGPDDPLWIVVGDKSHDWRCLALVSCDTDKGPLPKAIHRPQRDANARLIAAAPNMRAALETVSAVRPDNWEDGDDPEQVAAWRAVDAALAIGGPQ